MKISSNPVSAILTHYRKTSGFGKLLNRMTNISKPDAGFDQIDTLVSLRSSHDKGGKTMGLDMETGKPIEMLEKNVVEPLRVKTQAINSAAESAIMILRIDDVIASKSGGAPPDMGGMGGGMGGMGGMGDMGDY